MTAQGSDVILERMMALHPKVIDLTLDRMWRLLARLGHPEKRLPPVIHIAGTNGKGSTQAMIRAGLEGAGKRVHAYTSPHLARFHERVRLAGDLISEAGLIDALDRCYDANGGEEITYFEITTCAALLAFAETPADYTLLEVGLGGRLDATNVVDDPVATVITPVSMDHEQFLGDTIEAIAGEKAGIIKRGVPCVVSRQDPRAMEVIERVAARAGAPLLVQGEHWQVAEERGRLVYQDETGLLDLPLPALRGRHQYDNAGAALSVLRTLGVGETGAIAAMENVTWPARMQRLTTGPLVEAAGNRELWLDGGHNPAAGIALADLLGGLSPRPTVLISGMMNTKDCSGFLSPLARITDRLIAVPIPGEPNGLDPEVLAERARAVGMNAEVAATTEEAVALAGESAERILICGSLYLAGSILRRNG
ncbi:MAG: bifunctional folylpolyglutamate synthase/dihydrofolate synthase [Rhodobacteraceae bacterium]|nr:bifunctional folylpolyglutamate synthase/dihydrofolate synthase [Paracoccaceae bacterium]MAY46615.1 bifunctional folylpolyglutamate synthase/dihydrofolate synthase [Paracoccaceae bacterium]